MSLNFIYIAILEYRSLEYQARLRDEVCLVAVTVIPARVAALKRLAF